MAIPSGRKKKAITQKDIAEAVGVSQTLVSLVLGNSVPPMEVAEATRARILETAQRLGYATRKSRPRDRQLAVILPLIQKGHHEEHWIYDSLEDFYGRTQRHLAEAAFKRGYSLIVRPYEQATELTHWLSEWEVDGVVWHAQDDDLLKWVAARYPVVQMHYGTLVDADAVAENMGEISSQGLDYLYGRGHRRIAFLAEGGQVRPVRQDFVLSYQARARALGIPVYEDLVYRDYFGPEGSVELFLKMLEGDEETRPTALMTGDVIALYLARRIQERGFSIPGDVSILGIDNISASALYNPALTSVDVRQKEVSETAIDLLVARIKDPTSAYKKIFVTPKIVERQSVADLVSADVAAGKN